MSNNYVVYVHINKTNGKRYYGITSMKPKDRWRNGKGYPENEHFTSAINEYGWDGFDHIIVARNLTGDEAKWLEIEMIRKFDTTNRANGYNKTKGGESWNGFRHSKESKEKISKALKGRVFSKEHKKRISEANKGRCPSEETKRKISESNKGKQAGKNHPMYGVHRYGKDNPMYGKHHVDSTKQKISEANRGKKNHNAKSVICITTKRCFFTSTEASKFYSTDGSGIIKCCRGKQKSAGKLPDGTKLVWRYVNYKHNKTYRVA